MLDAKLLEHSPPSAWPFARPAFPAGRPMTPRAVFGMLFGAFVAAMLGLAAGALWMVLAIYLGRPMPWMVLAVAVVLAWAIRRGVHKPGNAAAVMAALATLLASIYVSLLIAGAQIAGSMGLGLIDSLRTAGASLLWQLARMSVSPSDIIWTLLAMLLAAWLGRRPLPVKTRTK